MQREDFVELFEIMAGLPVTIRLLDPPLHEFLPHDEDELAAVAEAAGVDVKRGAAARWPISRRANPMLGLRGCRLGILFPEIYEMQARAIFEAAFDGRRPRRARTVVPEVMIPLVLAARELQLIKQRIDAVAAEVAKERGGALRLPGRHHDRAAARGAAGRRDRRARRVLQLRHQRPDPDDAGPVARRFGQVPRALHRAEIFHGDPFQTLDPAAWAS